MSRISALWMWPQTTPSAPRFLASAFVSGPAFLIVTMFTLRRIAGVPIPDRPIQILVQIVRITIVINLLMVVSEAFTEFYTDSAHVAHAQYLFFGLHGKNALVPWIWWAIASQHYTWLVVLGLTYVGLKESAPLSLAGLGRCCGFALCYQPLGSKLLAGGQ